MSTKTNTEKYPLVFDLIVIPSAHGIATESIQRVKARETKTMYIVLKSGEETRYRKLSEPTKDGEVAFKEEKGSAFFRTTKESLYTVDTPFGLQMRESIRAKNRARNVTERIKELANANPTNEVFLKIEELLNACDAAKEATPHSK